MKKTYSNPVITVTTMNVVLPIAESMDKGGGSTITNAGDILGKERKEDEDKADDAWAEGLW